MKVVLIRPPGLLIEPLDPSWAVFSPLSGETHLLNDTSAALLDCLNPVTPRSAEEIYGEIAAVSGSPEQEVALLCAGCWPMLIQAGVVQSCLQAPSTDR